MIPGVQASKECRDTQRVGYYVSVGESIKLSHDRHLSLLPWFDQQHG